MNTTRCPYASSGCNYPEGQCIGLCMQEARRTNPFALAFWMDQSAIRWIVFWLLLAAAILALMGCDDHSYEQAIADDLQQVQREELAKANRVAKQISACIAQRGPGAAPVFDEQGFVTDCKPRRKS